MKKNQLNLLKSVFLSMLKIGCIGFGGGNALIPVLEKEFVHNKKLVSSEEYNKFVVMANITPGALPVEMATALGRHICGLPGMFIGPIGMALPGVFLTVLLVSLLSQVSGLLLTQVEYMSVGIGVFIIYLLIDYNIRTLKEFKLTSMKVKRILLIGFVFFLTCGKEVRSILGIGGTPVFDISTVDILIMAIFVIFYCCVNFSKIKVVVMAAICIPYVLSCGKMQIIKEPMVIVLLRVAMILLCVYSIWINVKKTGKTKQLSGKHLIKEECGCLLFVLLLSLPSYLCFKETITYVADGLVSTLISFGGGEAYLTVAEGMFLNTDMVTSNQLYGQLLPVVNSLPGSILCKMLSGIGYYIGLNESGSILVGYLTAIAGLSASIAASSGILVLVMYFYEKFEELEMFILLKKCVKPIVGGLLLSTSASLLSANIQVGLGIGWSTPKSLLVMLVLFASVVVARMKTKLPNIILILITGIVTLGLYHIL